MLRLALTWLLSAWLVVVPLSAFAQLTMLGVGPGGAAGGGSNVPTFVQGNNHQNGATSTTSIQVTLTSAVASADIVVGAVTWGGLVTDQVTLVTDDKGNTCNIVSANPVFNSVAGFDLVTFACPNLTNGPSIYTATISVARQFGAITIDEIAHVAASSPIDTQAAQAVNVPGTGANAVTSGAATTAASGDMIWAFGASLASAGFTAGTSFTLNKSYSSTYYTESLIQGAAGSIAGTFTAANGSDQTFAAMVALKHGP